MCDDLDLNSTSFITEIASSIHQQLKMAAETTVPQEQGVTDLRAVLKLNIHVGEWAGENWENILEQS